MSGLKTQLEIGADASGAQAGITGVKRSLADLGGSAAAAGKQAAAGVSAMGGAADGAAAKVDAATRSMIGSIQRQIAVAEAGGRGTAAYYESLAKAKGIDPEAVRPYLAQLEQVAGKTQQVGVSAAQTAAAMRGLPAQVTDIVTSLASGQQPLTVMLQQGGQLKDMFGGIGPAARALGGAMVSLVNPLTVGAAAAAALALAYKQGSDEADGYRLALLQSGNAAGVTSGQLAVMARQMAAGASTQHAAAEALAALAGSTHVAGADLERLGSAALAMQRGLGQPIAETVKALEDLGKSPVEASRKLNDALNYLTASAYAQIKALADQGREADAASLAQRSYAEAMRSRAAEAERGLGTLQSAWRDIATDARRAWDAMLDIGRGQTVDERIAALQSQISAAMSRQSRSGDGLLGQMLGKLSGSQIADAQAELQRLQSVKGFDDAFAQQEARNKAIADAGIKASDYFDKLRSGQKTTEALNKALAEYDRNIAAASKAGLQVPSAQQQTRDRQDIRDRYTDSSERKARMAQALEEIRRAGEMEVRSYANTEQRIEALHSAGLASDAQYYAAKRALVESQAQAQGAAVSRQIERLQAERATGAEAVQVQQQIAALRSQAADVAATASTKVWLLDQQEAAGIRAKRAELLAYTQQLDDMARAQQRTQARDISGIGIGAQARSMQAGMDQIADRYSQQRQALANARAQQEAKGSFGSEQLAEYTARLRELDAAEQSSADSYRAYWAAKEDALGSWQLGAQEALRNYQDQARDTFTQTASLVNNAFRSMEDALVAFVVKGKLDFKSLAESIISDIVRIQARQFLAGSASSGGGALDLLMGLAGLAGGGMTVDTSVAGATGGITSDVTLPDLLRGGRAAGGPVDAGALYQVNERGPELLSVGGKDYLMMGAQSGVVTPNGGSAAGAPTVHLTLNASVGDVVTQQQLARFGAQVRESTARGVFEAMRRAGARA